jgi:hypothetical protein
MAANTSPIFSLKGDQSTDNGTTMNAAMVTATGDYTGISANHVLVYTAHATDGGFIEGIKFIATGTNTASVARIYINNGSTQTTATNNRFFGQQTLPATTAINTAATAEIFFPMGIALKAGFRVYAGLGTTVAASWVCMPIAGQYA